MKYRAMTGKYFVKYANSIYFQYFGRYLIIKE